ncbi:MAG: hypothetical protein FWG67_06495 [Defluviitaleaceae bacterium]|nr:hypothetical protein [Defluviitaleaceae bacterium]
MKQNFEAKQVSKQIKLLLFVSIFFTFMIVVFTAMMGFINPWELNDTVLDILIATTFLVISIIWTKTISDIPKIFSRNISSKKLSQEERVEKYLETILSILIVIFACVASIAIMLIPLLFRQF